MAWKKKKRKHGKNRYYSVANKLRREKKTSPQFEVMLNGLSLEEVIALKLELAAKASGSPLYGIPIWKNLITITRDAVIKFALSATRTKKEAARFLGMAEESFWRKQNYYQTESFFADEEEKEVLDL